MEELDEQGRVTYVSGYFEFRKVKLKFVAFGMEGYGGPNIGATFSDETLSSLRQLGLDHAAIEELITGIQSKITEGEAHIELKDNQVPAASSSESKR